MRLSFPDLSAADIAKHPIWRFTNNDPEDELEIESVASRALDNLDGLIIGSKVMFSDGSTHLALFQNVSLTEQKKNDHFLSLTVERNGEWFPLARYHDPALEKWGPSQLAAFMDKTVKQIFPIKYDLREVLKSDAPTLVGIVRAKPLERLTRDELISWVVSSLPDDPSAEYPTED